MRLLSWLVCLGLIAVSAPARAQDRLNVVASFSILGDFVRNVGGDSVNVAVLVGPDSDAHVYAPTPADAKKVADAKLVFVNGLGFEGWLPRLVKAAGGKASVVTATSGIAPLKLGSEADPHAWQSVANAKIYVANIRDALAAAAPADAEGFKARAAAYLAGLDALERDVHEAIAKIPEGRRKVISTALALILLFDAIFVPRILSDRHSGRPLIWKSHRRSQQRGAVGAGGDRDDNGDRDRGCRSFGRRGDRHLGGHGRGADQSGPGR